MRVAVIGGGPGGYVCAIRLRQLGAEVTLIEKEHIGGTCLNVGCIPTKALLHAAHLYDECRTEGPQWGITSDYITVDWQKVQNQKQKIVDRLVKGVGGLLAANGVHVIRGCADFTAEHTLAVTTRDSDHPDPHLRQLTFDKIVISVGARPKIPPIPGADLPRVITSTEALSLPALPERLCIIGGGVIGCEMAGIYAALGTKVTILEVLPDILTNLEKDTVAVLKHRFERNGIAVHTGVKIDRITECEEGLKVSTAAEDYIGDYVLMAAGRGPDLGELGLEKAGVQTERGFIKVNPQTMVTTNPDIYAVGDCNGGIQLAHVASAEGETAAEHLTGHQPAINLSVVPSGLYTTPELASVGMTEEQARAAGYDVKNGIFPLAGNGKSLITGDEDGLVKLVTDRKTGEILGMHMAGPRATDLIAEGALALRLECTVDEIISTIHGHPTVSEAVAEAAMDAEDRTIHMPPKK